MERHEALQRLENLPTTAAIADELVSMGITAQPRKGDRCAIAVYMKQTTGEAVSVGLQYLGAVFASDNEDEAIGVTLHGNGTDVAPQSFDFYSSRSKLWNYPTPKVAQFIREFDMGVYPKLEEVAAGSGCPKCGGVNSYNCSTCKGRCV